jgi:hypothetical protein
VIFHNSSLNSFNTLNPLITADSDTSFWDVIRVIFPQKVLSEWIQGIWELRDVILKKPLQKHSIHQFFKRRTFLNILNRTGKSRDLADAPSLWWRKVKREGGGGEWRLGNGDLELGWRKSSKRNTKIGKWDLLRDVCELKKEGKCGRKKVGFEGEN